VRAINQNSVSAFVTAVIFFAATCAHSQDIPDPVVMGPSLAAKVQGLYSSVSTPSSGKVVNAPVVGNGDMALMIGGPSTSLSFVVGKSDFWGVEHGVIMPVGTLVLTTPSLSGSSNFFAQNVGAANVTGSFITASSGLSLNAWIAASQNTAYLQLTNTGPNSLTFSSKLLDAYGTSGNPATLGYTTNSTWLNVSPDAVFLELGNHVNIGSAAPLQGRIANLEIFDQALSSSQLTGLESPGAVPPWLQWTATNTGTATLKGSGASLNAADPHGGSVVLSGDSASEVQVGVAGLPQTQFSVSAWVYLTAINSGNENCIFAGLVNHGTSGYPFLRGFKFVVLANGALSATLNASGSAGTSPGSLFFADFVNAYTASATGALPLNQWIQTSVTYDGNTLTVYTNGVAVAAKTSFPSAAQVNGYNKTAIHLGDTNTAFNGCAPRGVLMQSIFGVSVTDSSNTLTFTIPPGGHATIALAAVTDRNTTDFFSVAQQQSQQADSSTLISLLQEHDQWWSNFWTKSFVQIPDKLVQDEWYASLYLLACCSKSNCPPPGLWGNFISSTGMSWEGDYTLDYNYQATFWAALACNHNELADNYDGLLLDHIPRGQASAQHWGYQGIYLYTHLIPFPGWSDDGFTFWSQKSDAIFAAVNCAMRWRYTGDTNYAARVYPFLKGVSDFWDNYLVLSNNTYMDYNDAAGESSSTSDVNPATSLAFIQLVYPSLIEMSQVLNLDAGRRAKWSDIVARLAPLPIVPATSISSLNALGPNYLSPGENVIRDTASGTAFPTPEVAVYTDHQIRGSSPGMNSTQVIFPGWNIGFESSSNILAAAKSTVRLAAEWFDGNDCCTFYPSAAAVGIDPGLILTNLDNLIIYHAYPNFMFSFGGGGTEDYAVVPCTLANMFLQSHQTNLHLFPNWPLNQNASFGNLNACGGFLVSSAMTNGFIPYVQVTSTAGQMLKMVNPWLQATVRITSSLNPEMQLSGNILNYQTQAGEVLTLTPSDPPVAVPPTPTWLGVFTTNGQITISWTTTAATSGYNVRRSVDGTNFVIVATNSPATSYADTDFSFGPTYFYEVSAVNSLGESANTPILVGSLAPATPANFIAVSGSNQVMLQWSGVQNALGYNVKRSSFSGGPYATTASGISATNYTDTTVTNWATYYYVVSATNSLGESLNSTEASVTLITPPTRLEAESYSTQSGIQTETCQDAGGTLDVAYINSGDWCSYPGVDFGSATLRLNARVASAAAGGNIEVHLGTTNGPLVGNIAVPVTPGWQTYSTVSCALTNVSGVQTLAVRFTGAGTGYLFNVNWFEFTPVSTAPILLPMQRTGQQLQFAWPMDHLGWRLQAQTNSTGFGIGTNWVTLSGSAATNIISVPIDPRNGNVFFRLIFP
jgi:fibronectin type 3 domain-containing protein